MSRQEAMDDPGSSLLEFFLPKAAAYRICSSAGETVTELIEHQIGVDGCETPPVSKTKSLNFFHDHQASPEQPYDALRGRLPICA